jgi:hypothetical protein
MRKSFALLFVIIFAPSAAAQSRDGQTVSIGPWAIATHYKTDKFENCTMSRSAGELGITFVRTQDGLLVLLDSPKWKLNRGKAYPVRLVAGSRSVNAQAVAEPKSVTIALEDSRLNSNLRLANVLKCVEKAPPCECRWIEARRPLSDLRRASPNARRRRQIPS